MNKKIIINILKRVGISNKDLNTFITEYIFWQKEKEITTQELLGISQLIKRNIFDLQYAARLAAIHLKLNVIYLIDKNNNIINVNVYD